MVYVHGRLRRLVSNGNSDKKRSESCYWRLEHDWTPHLVDIGFREGLRAKKKQHVPCPSEAPAALWLWLSWSRTPRASPKESQSGFVKELLKPQRHQHDKVSGAYLWLPLDRLYHHDQKVRNLSRTATHLGVRGDGIGLLGQSRRRLSVMHRRKGGNETYGTLSVPGHFSVRVLRHLVRLIFEAPV